MVKPSRPAIARNCEMEQEDTEAGNPPPTNTKNQEMNLESEMAIATQAMGET